MATPLAADDASLVLIVRTPKRSLLSFPVPLLCRRLNTVLTVAISEEPDDWLLVPPVTVGTDRQVPAVTKSPPRVAARSVRHVVAAALATKKGFRQRRCCRIKATQVTEPFCVAPFRAYRAAMVGLRPRHWRQ